MKVAGNFHRFASQVLLFDLGIDSKVAFRIFFEFHIRLFLLLPSSHGGGVLTCYRAGGPLASRIQLRLSLVLRLLPMLSVLINEDLELFVFCVELVLSCVGFEDIFFDFIDVSLN
mmetsp:Transcript_37955/g.36360  ORF Transcript_37955/g.36360 Transcript_37955/m.36360 type:complete len:115 (+) Transcript_37955:231-575(+)